MASSGEAFPEADDDADLTVADISAGVLGEPGRPVAPQGWPSRAPATGTVPAYDDAAGAGISCLVVTSGRDLGRVFQLSPGTSLSIGRATDNAVTLSDIAVSRHHLILRWSGSYWTVDDCGSSNGIRINEAFVAKCTPLREGDFLEVGNTLLQLTRDDSGLGYLSPRRPRGTDRPALSRVSATTERHIHTVDPELLARSAPPLARSGGALPAADSPVGVRPRRGSSTAGELSADTGLIRAPSSFLSAQPVAGWSAEHNHFLVRAMVATILASLGFAAMMTTSEAPPPAPSPAKVGLEYISRWVTAAADELRDPGEWSERAYRWLAPTSSP